MLRSCAHLDAKTLPPLIFRKIQPTFLLPLIRTSAGYSNERMNADSAIRNENKHWRHGTQPYDLGFAARRRWARCFRWTT